jgi:ketosteroid isomerase-like protein
VAVAHVLTVRGDKVVQARYFIDTPTMLAALRA